MSLRSGLLALGSGAALGLATAVALGVGAFEEEAAIVVRPVELVDPAPEDPFDLAPLLAPRPGTASRPGSGSGSSIDDPQDARDTSGAGDAVRERRTDDPVEVSGDRPIERTVELAGGDVVTIRIPDEPALRLAPEDVAFLELAESTPGEDGRLDADVDAESAVEAEAEAEAEADTDANADTDTPADAEAGAGVYTAVPTLRFAVYAVLADSGREAWTPFAARHANTFLLVEIAGRAVDLVRPLGWSRGLRIGVFPDELTRARYVESLDLETH